jgi:transposase
MGVIKESGQSKRIRHSKEFKLEALRQLELGQKSGTQLALELGIRRNQLYKWQAELGKQGKDNAFRGSGRKPLIERSEIERLQHELKRVTEERDILKKAAAYFARELP